MFSPFSEPGASLVFIKQYQLSNIDDNKTQKAFNEYKMKKNCEK